MAGMFDPYFYGRMRREMPPSDPMHSVIAPLEHREFVRESVGRDPRMAAPMAVAIPGYTVGKRMGEVAQRHPASTMMMPGGLPMMMLLARLGLLPKENTSPASLDEVFAGYEGLFSGLKDYVEK